MSVWIGYFLRAADPSRLRTRVHTGAEFRSICPKVYLECFKVLSSNRIKNLEEADKYKLIDSKSRFSLWKPRFDDLLIVSEKQFRTKLDYIHENPVRVDLVEGAAIGCIQVPSIG